MVRSKRAASALVAIAVTIVTTGVLPHAAAESLSTAKARAAALTKTVNRLQTEAEVATEHYDATQARLTVAVAERGRADQALSAVQANASTAAQAVGDHARALYESGGDPALIASLLAGQSPTQVLANYRMADDVLANENRAAVSAAAAVGQAHTLEARAAAVSRTVTRLQIAQQAAAARIQGLLASQRHALASAKGTVRHIMRADERAAALAAAAAFANAVNAAGGTLDPSGSTTPPNNVAAMAIAAARSRLGVPYVWGATGPDAFDCSGLTQWSYAHAGISLPRTAAEQWNAGPHPSLSDLEPGDLLFWALNTSDPATIHHVAMYIGHGMMIAAPHTGENVQIQPVYMTGFIGAMRPWANSPAASS
jgi:peptidoglycan DL-endopeptidase CwlO